MLDSFSLALLGYTERLKSIRMWGVELDGMVAAFGVVVVCP